MAGGEMINKACSFFRNLYYKIRYGYKIDRAEAELREWSVRLKAGSDETFNHHIIDQLNLITLILFALSKNI